MARGVSLSALVNSPRMAFRSPRIASSEFRSLLNSAASASMCIVRALGAKPSSLPVARSSRRAPITSRRSHSSTARLAARDPCMPSMPRLWVLYLPGFPIPLRVTTAGSSEHSENSRKRSSECARLMPPPLYSRGLRAARSKAIAPVRSGQAVGGGAGVVMGAMVVSVSNTSLGISIQTGPGRPLWASFMAPSRIPGSSSALSTR